MHVDESQSSVYSSFAAVYGAPQIDSEDVVYILTDGNMFDKYLGLGKGKSSILTYLMTRQFLSQFWAQVRVKILGIPEMDKITEVHARKILFLVRDISRERFSNHKVLHWISGAYQVIGVKHTINPEKAYTTELLIYRSGYGSPELDTEVEEEAAA